MGKCSSFFHQILTRFFQNAYVLAEYGTYLIGICFFHKEFRWHLVPEIQFQIQHRIILFVYYCLVFLQVPKCIVLVQIFWASPKIYLHIVPVTNSLCQTKRWFAFSKIGFCAATKVFEEALNAVKFLGWLKKFGPAQNILRPVKGQGIGTVCTLMCILYQNL